MFGTQLGEGPTSQLGFARPNSLSQFTEERIATLEVFLETGQFLPIEVEDLLEPQEPLGVG